MQIEKEKKRGVICLRFSKSSQRERNMASESFLPVPTVSNLQETDAVFSLNHVFVYVCGIYELWWWI